MKKILSAIALILLLCSCKTQTDFKNTFAKPRLFDVTFEDDALSLRGELLVNGDTAVFRPSDFNGLIITATKEGVSVSLDGIDVFEHTSLSRFGCLSDLYNQKILNKDGIKIIENGTYKIIIHKELATNEKS